MENKKVLLTGGLGYIGSHTCVELLNAGYEVVCIDNLYNTNAVVKKRVETITGKQFVWEDIDINDKDKLSEVFEKHGPFGGVIHFAAFTDVGESVTKPLDYYHNNVAGTITLLQVMQKWKCNVFVFSSSACVYGNNPKGKFVETDPLGAINPYG